MQKTLCTKLLTGDDCLLFFSNNYIYPWKSSHMIFVSNIVVSIIIHAWTFEIKFCVVWLLCLNIYFNFRECLVFVIFLYCYNLSCYNEDTLITFIRADDNHYSVLSVSFDPFQTHSTAILCFSKKDFWKLMFWEIIHFTQYFTSILRGFPLYF